MASSRSSSRHKREYQGIDSGGQTPPDFGEKPVDGSINYPATGQPVIEGTAEFGEVLFANTSSIQDQNGLRPFTYQWQRDGVDIPNTNSEFYTVQAADIGTQIRVYITFIDGDGYQEGPLYSEPTAIVPGTNLPPEGIPAITGTPIEAQTLSCDTSGISDPDGVNQSTWVYQWQRGEQFGQDPDFIQWENIPGASSIDYVLTAAEVDHYVRVYVYFDDNLGETEGPLYSEATEVVIQYNRPATGKPVISGTPIEGQMLAAGVGTIADENGFDPATIQYYWRRNDMDLPRAPSVTYTLVADDVDQMIGLRATFVDDAGYNEQRVADNVGPVAEYNREATGRPAITGTPIVGYTLTASQGTIADYNGVGPLDWQWHRDGVDINGQTGETYTLVNADLGSVITVSATFIDQRGYPEGPLTSNPTSVITSTEGYLHDFSTAQESTPGLYGLGGFTHDRLSEAYGSGHKQRIQSHAIDEPVFTGAGTSRNDDQLVGYGLQIEGAETNHATYSNDFSNPAWAKTNVTVSGSELTSTVNDATVLQTVTLGTAARTFSVAISRITGRDPIYISAGNDVWEEVDVQGHFWRFSTTQTAANPTFGIKFATAGTTALVEFGQLEDGAYPSSYIDTLDTPVQRREVNVYGTFEDFSPLPPAGFANNYCGQFVFMLRRSVAEIYNEAGMEVIVVEIYNETATDAFEVAITSDKNIQLRSRINNSTAGRELNFDVTGADQWAIMDVRFQKTDSVTNSFVGWLNTTRQSIGAQGDAAIAPMDRMVLGSDESFTNHADVNFIRARVHSNTLLESEITDWASWEAPAPIVDKDPDNILVDRGAQGFSTVACIHPAPVFQWQSSPGQVIWSDIENVLAVVDGHHSTKLVVGTGDVPDGGLWIRTRMEAVNDPTKFTLTALASLNVNEAYAGVDGDFFLSALHGFDFLRASAATGYNYLGNTQQVGGDVPVFIGGRYDTAWHDESVGYGLQLEPERYNYLGATDDLTNAAWVKEGSTTVVTSGTIDNYPAFLLGGTAYFHGINYLTTIPAPLTPTDSLFLTFRVQAGSSRGTDDINFYIRETGGSHIDVSNFTTTLVGPGTVAGGEFNAIGLQDLSADTHTEVTVQLTGVTTATADIDVIFWPGNLNDTLTKNVIISHPQLEVGNYATSFIHNPDLTPRQRAADKLSLTFEDHADLPDLGVANNYTAQATIRLKHDVAATESYIVPIHLVDTTGTNRCQVYANSTGVWTMQCIIDGASSTVIGPTLLALAGDTLDFVARKDNTGLAFWVNGTKYSDAIATGNHGTALTVACSNHHSDTDQYFAAFELPVFKVYPAALTDEDVAALPVWSEPLPIITTQPEDINFGGGIIPEEQWLEEDYWPEFRYPDPEKFPVAPGATVSCIYVVRSNMPVSYEWHWEGFDNEQVETNGYMFHAHNVRYDQNGARAWCTATAGDLSVTSTDGGADHAAILYVEDTGRAPWWTNSSRIGNMNRGYTEEQRYVHLHNVGCRNHDKNDTGSMLYNSATYRLNSGPATLTGAFLEFDQELAVGKHAVSLTAINEHGEHTLDYELTIFDDRQQPTTGQLELNIISAPNAVKQRPLWDGRVNYVGQCMFPKPITPFNMDYGGQCFAKHPESGMWYAAHHKTNDKEAGTLSLFENVNPGVTCQRAAGTDYIKIPIWRDLGDDNILAALHVGNRVITTRNDWYDNSPVYDEGFTYTDENLTVTQAPTYWTLQDVNNRNYRFKSHYTGYIPPEWQEFFEAPHFCGGGQQSIISTCNAGYSFFTCDFNDIEEPDWTGLALAENPYGQAPIFEYNMKNPIAQFGAQNPCGSLFVPGYRTWACLGMCTPNTRYYKRNNSGGYNILPTFLGWHLYDILDLLEVKAERKLAKDVTPYAIVPFDLEPYGFPYSPTDCFTKAGTVVDYEANRIYNTMPHSEGAGGMRIHIWDIV